MRARQGFTFAELLVVVIIISLLAAILLPVFGRAVSKGYQIRCVGNLANLGGALRVYAADFAGKYPPEENWGAVLCGRVLLPEAVILCPSLARRDLPTEPYLYRGGLEDDGSPLGVVMSDVYGDLHNGGANFLFADGHVKWIRKETTQSPPGARGYQDKIPGMKGLRQRQKRLGGGD